MTEWGEIQGKSDLVRVKTETEILCFKVKHKISFILSIDSKLILTNCLVHFSSLVLLKSR